MTEKKATTIKKFNPEEYMTDIKGKKYLPVAWRLVWFREEHPDWTIATEIVENTNNYAIMKAKIISPDRVIATAHKKEDVQGFGDYMEKAETGAIGRALAMCGYGTQFAPELEEGTERIVDSPQAVKTITPQAPTDSRVGKITLPQLGKIRALYGEKHLDEQAMKLVIKKMYGVDSHKELSVSEASDYISYLINDVKEQDTLADLDGGLPDFK